MCSILLGMKLLHWQISTYRYNKHFSKLPMKNVLKKIELTLVLNFFFLNVALIKHIFSFGTSIFCFGFFGSLLSSTRHKSKNPNLN